MKEFIHIPQEAFEEIQSRLSFSEKENALQGKDYFLKNQKVGYYSSDIGLRLYYIEKGIWEKDGADKLKKTETEASNWQKEREQKLLSERDND